MSYKHCVQTLEQRIKDQAYQLGFCQLGITNQHTPNSFKHYKNWIDQGYHQNMHYLSEERRLKLRQNVEGLMPNVKSVMVGAVSYHTKDPQNSQIKFAKYGWGPDYHMSLKAKFEKLALWIQQTLGLAFEYKTFVDTAPILERDFAAQAGVGWVGKNTMIMNQKDGSNLYLGVMLTTLSLTQDKHLQGHCGTCTACLDACPTDALEKPFVLNAQKCISYQTIENRFEPIPKEIETKLENWIAGCDICQDVCPWNYKAVSNPSPSGYLPTTIEEIQKMDTKKYKEIFAGSAFSRIPLQKLQSTAQTLLDQGLDKNKL